MAFDVAVAGICVVAVLVALVPITAWGKRLPQGFMYSLAWIGTALLLLRLAAVLVQTGYLIAAGRFRFAMFGIWDWWFLVGTILFTVSTWCWRRTRAGQGTAEQFVGRERRARVSRPRSARQIASENLSKPDVQGRIAASISESGVDPREVIGTLASHMRADMTDFFDGDYLPEVIGIAAQRGLGHLIKRIKSRRWVDGKGDNAKKVEEIDFEIARDNPAAVQLSKILRLDHVPHVKST